MMSQHTPGPWTTTLPQGGILIRTENKGKPCTWIAEVFKNGASRLVGENAASEEGTANACLIVAAPDLLEACKGLLTAAKNGASLERFYDNEIDALWIACESAIARAETAIIADTCTSCGKPGRDGICDDCAFAEDTTWEQPSNRPFLRSGMRDSDVDPSLREYEEQDDFETDVASFRGRS